MARSYGADRRGILRAMSQENVEIVRAGFERFAATGEFAANLSTDDFAWDMSNFHGWPEQQVYEGAEGARAFMTEWLDAWEDWRLEVEALHDAGDRVVALVHQRARSKAGGMPVEMSFAMVFTIRDGRQARMEMYSDRDEALAAAGLAE
jgi:ketosteroid isomerase-like protein